MTRRVRPAAALVLAMALVAPWACKSSAPYTLQAAGISTALGLGVSAQQRAEGGCYAMCTNGTQCNPRTGLCEPTLCGACQGWEACVETEVAWRCVSKGTQTLFESQHGKATTPGEVVPGLGLSPLTGSVPQLPPAKASPAGP
ncbi:MAG TPA: hypothetical protein VMK12_09120 [Anaeromyxobacteraceae bacterium]|nr:hypothetical protein [Anaeromyxobacteraceae bacterium]